MNAKGKSVAVLLGMAVLALVASSASAKAPSFAKATADKSADKQASSPKPQAAKTAQAPSPKPQAPSLKTTPPLPAMGFAPVRPMDIVRATYDFAAQHPEILKYVPCYCGCGADGHSANESCFIARRDAKGNVLEWDTHGFGCTICVDVAREAMQLYSSGADVVAIRNAIEKRWAANVANRTPTPFPPKK